LHDFGCGRAKLDAEKTIRKRCKRDSVYKNLRRGEAELSKDGYGKFGKIKT
jgi:hypothetical protein